MMISKILLSMVMNYIGVGIYLRLSNEDNNKIDESESIKNQRNLLLDYINTLYNNFKICAFYNLNKNIII